MSINTITTGFRGEYNIVITRADGSTTETGWFKNLVLDIGLDRLGSSAEIIKFARVGTGTSTPAVTQTALDAQIASTSSGISSATSRVNSGAPLYQSLYTYTFAFAQGAVVGNITEVGIGWQQTGATLFSRALILDGSGNPTTLTITSIDQLTVYYRLNLVPGVTDTTGSVTLGSTAYSFTCRPSQIASFGASTSTFQQSGDWFSNAYPNITTYGSGATIGPITGAPSGTSSTQQPTITNSAYSAGTFYRNSTWSWGPTLANYSGGLQAIQFVWGTNSNYYYQIVFDTPIPKTNTNTLTLQMRFIWGRA